MANEAKNSSHYKKLQAFYNRAVALGQWWKQEVTGEKTSSLLTSTQNQRKVFAGFFYVEKNVTTLCACPL
jgi:hypothetical protein